MKDQKFKAPFRTGRKVKRVILDAQGLEVVYFHHSVEQSFIDRYVIWMNNSYDSPAIKPRPVTKPTEARIVRMVTGSPQLRTEELDFGQKIGFFLAFLFLVAMVLIIWNL
tara:strand:- start:51902 stop:52231 length:330 start_codon:yes stop_codon:yes gene_type:complete